MVEVVLNDFRLAVRSRQTSLIGRREVFSSKAKFGIFGEGKEIAQIAMAKVFKPGDFRSGYYRDQTFMFAIGGLTIQQYFSQLYAHADLQAEPATGGRLMNGHFATRTLNPDGSWKELSMLRNSSADLSPTGSQMPRLVGLAYASRLYRELENLKTFTQFSNHGREIAFGMIGNASTSEGMFWESVNAIGVLKSPAIITIYDDGYGISVPNENQMVKGDLSAILEGFRRDPNHSCEGYDLYTLPGWDYPGLIQAYQQAEERAREEHVPAIFHITELTQPQGHSTSGSQERYKTKERLEWEQECDALRVFREWIVEQSFASTFELEKIEAEECQYVEECRKAAWEDFLRPILTEREEVVELLQALKGDSEQPEKIQKIQESLMSPLHPARREINKALFEALVVTRKEHSPSRTAITNWKEKLAAQAYERFSSDLYSEAADSALRIPVIPPIYQEDASEIMGFEILNAAFDSAFAREPRLVAFGEDVGKLGDVNQGFRGLQAKYGELRISDTGIREATILGQAIGMALRGLRPIAEIQYLDYLLYALQIISDDLATLRWRTKAGQKAPVIIRTRGHRLEGVWHSGSPMAGIINLVRGIYILTPRNMTQAAGFYNTLLLAEEPAVVVEVLNGYRIKERLPANIHEFTTPLGVPEIIRSGSDITLVTYGACCRIALETAEALSRVGIESEVVDVQSLLPFDLHGKIGESIQKTGRMIFIDEDVPGGTTAYMMQEVLERQNGYHWLDSAPRTITGKSHRPAYGSDGDYWSKPNAEEIFEAAYNMMNESDPRRYTAL